MPHLRAQVLKFELAAIGEPVVTQPLAVVGQDLAARLPKLHRQGEALPRRVVRLLQPIKLLLQLRDGGLWGAARGKRTGELLGGPKDAAHFRAEILDPTPDSRLG